MMHIDVTGRAIARRGILLVVTAVFSMPGALRAQDIDLDRLIPSVETAVREMIIEGRVPSATVALVAGNRVLWTGGYGHANLWAHTPAVPTTVYLIGSTFKAMSTFALLQQMEQGKFALDEPVSAHLADLTIRRENREQPITFRHLLTHTSGLPGAFGPFAVWSDSVPRRLERYLAEDLEVVSAPLDSVRYSNLAYSLVAYLVEKFSGVPYKEYMQQYIFDTLEMTSTAFDPSPDMDERLSVPYVLDRNGRPTPALRLKAEVWPAGIVYGTVRDQANWLIVNLNDGVFKGRQLLTPATVQEMHRRQYDRFAGPMAGGFGNDSSGYGLTWWTAERGGDRYFAHSGSVPGYTAFLLGNKTRRLGFAVLTNGNRAHPHLVRLAHRAIDLMIEHSNESPASAGRLGAARVDR